MELILQTKRLYLRRFTEQDAQLLYNLNLDPEVIKYTQDPIKDVEHAAGILSAVIIPQYQLYKLGRWAVHLKHTNEFIGWCGLKFMPEINEIDLGYRFMKKYWGNGYAYESASACISYGFDSLKLKGITAWAVPENIASCNVLEKCGMQYIREEIVDGHVAKRYGIQNPGTATAG